MERSLEAPIPRLSAPSEEDIMKGKKSQTVSSVLIELEETWRTSPSMVSSGSSSENFYDKADPRNRGKIWAKEKD